MATAEELAEARATVLAAQKRARRKMARLKRQNNADVFGTRLDPTRGADVKRLNMRQLEARLARIEAFQSRRVQFYGDSSGRLISDRTVREYKRAVRQMNRVDQGIYREFANMKLPTGESVETRHRRLREGTYTGRRRPQNIRDLSKKYEVNTKGFSSEGAIKKMTRFLQRAMVGRYDRDVRESNDQVQAILERVGDDALSDAYSRLNNKQKYLLNFHSGFVGEMKFLYESTRYRERGGKGEFSGEERTRTHVHELVAWAKKKRIR